ncbi:MAG: Mrp/NBP35 family ATP-binding protein [Acidimicrobiia bacterium]
MAGVPEATILEALRSVVDPQLRSSVVDLGLVDRVETRRSSVRIHLRWPLPNYPDADQLRGQVEAVVAALPGVRGVDIEVSTMDDEDRRRLAARLRPEGAEAARPLARSSTRVLAVASGKGGVGKSSVTTNLAVALATLGHDVAALDADVWGFSMPRMLGVRRPPMAIDSLIVPPSAHGVRLISMGFFTGEDQPVIWRGPMLHKALEQFLTDVYWGEPEYLVVDMPPGTGDVSLSMSQFLPRAEVIVVTTPQPAAQKVAQRAAYMAQKVNLGIAGVVENMSFFRGDDGKVYELFGRGGGELLSESLGVPLLGQIPLVTALREGGDDGMPIVVADPDSEASQVFFAIARGLSAEVPKRIYRSELRIG